jgi:hypothetical protein
MDNKDMDNKDMYNKDMDNIDNQSQKKTAAQRKKDRKLQLIQNIADLEQKVKMLQNANVKYKDKNKFLFELLLLFLQSENQQYSLLFSVVFVCPDR